MTRRKIALVVVSTGKWQEVRANPEPIREALRHMQPGGYQEVDIQRERRLRNRDIDDEM